MARKSNGGVTSFSSDFGTPIPLAGPGEEVRSDFRDVPLSDTGDGYHDRGALGSYGRDAPWDPVPGVKYMAGFGADVEDLQRGFIAPTIREDPAYDKANYRERSSLPMKTDEDFNNTGVLDEDWEFRTRNRRSRGFLTRPYIPTER
jgi:hypothetical protein